MNLLNHNNVWRAHNLPDGLSIKDGVISGIPTTRGIHSIPITVSNSLGQSTKNIRIRTKYRDDIIIMKNGAELETITPATLQASIQDGSAQNKYDCTNTQMLIDIIHPLTGAVMLDVPLNFCSFRTVKLQDGSTKTGLILQFAHTLWKGVAPFSTNNFNRWKYSQLRKWLNSSGTGWFTSSYSADILTHHDGSYTDDVTIGFLSCLPSALVEAIVPVEVVTQAFFDDNNTDTAIDDPDYIDGLDADITYDKIFIPSLSEMAIASGGNASFPDTGFEGTAWEYYSALNDGTQIASDFAGIQCSIITRSAYLDGTTQILYVDSHLVPSASDTYCSDASPAPAFVIA